MTSHFRIVCIGLLLLAALAPPVCADSDITEMTKAARKGDIKMVESFLKQGVHVDGFDKWGFTALTGASSNGNVRIVELLLSYGADINLKAKDHTTALSQACFGNHKEVINLLIAKGADVNSKKKNGWTPLMAASLNGDKETIDLLLTYGADINATNDIGNSVLHLLAALCDAGTISYLVNKGAKANTKNIAGYTYRDLLQAARCKSEAVEKQKDASAESNFVTIRLPNGVTIGVPSDWQVATGDQRISIDTAVKFQLDLSSLPKVTSDLVFIAGYFDDVGDKAKINIRYYPDSKVTQDAMVNANSEEIAKFDDALRQSSSKAAKAFGGTIVHWGGTRKQILGNLMALVTEYSRSPNPGEQGRFNVRQIQILDGPRSFTFMVSYNEIYSVKFKPICDRIISSLKIQ